MQTRKTRIIGAAIGAVLAPLLDITAGAAWGGYTKRLPDPVGLDQKPKLEQFRICAVGWGAVFAIYAGPPALIFGLCVGGAIGVLMGRDHTDSRVRRGGALDQSTPHSP
jgi:hypothetical protein